MHPPPPAPPPDETTTPPSSKLFPAPQPPSLQCSATACPQVIELITKAARKGATPSQIGVLLRDQHGINQVGAVCRPDL